MIEDKDIERVLDWLVANGPRAAESRAQRVYMEEFRKTIKSRLMKESGQESVAAQEREAYSSPEYIAHLKALRAAVMDDELYRWRLTAAEAKISAWQTMSRMARAQEKVT